MGKRGQASFEYLTVVGFAFLLTIPLVIVFFSTQANMQDDMTRSQTHKIVTEIVQQAETLSYIGYPSKTTLSVTFPANVQTATVGTDHLQVTIQTSSGTSDVVSYTVASLAGELGTFEGLHVITLETLPDGTVSITEK